MSRAVSSRLQWDEIDDDETGPPGPAGVGQLSAGLKALVDFFGIDEDLIAIAAASSPAIEEPAGLAEWIATLPAEEKDELLTRTAAGEGAQVQVLLLRRFRAAGSSPAAAAPGRTAAQLWEAAAERKEARVEAMTQRRREEEARRAAARAAAHAQRLDQLATRSTCASPRCWSGSTGRASASGARSAGLMLTAKDRSAGKRGAGAGQARISCPAMRRRPPRTRGQAPGRPGVRI